MRCEVVAIGSELLLGQIVDTNSVYIGEQLALVGIDSFYQTKVGDNLERMIEVLRLALERSDAVICCGGLGPTHDDITRAAIAAVMGVELERDPALVEKIRAMFGTRGRDMSDNNLLQADVPVGASINPAQPGTAPGLMCPVPGTDDGRGRPKMIYAVPGVPWEMKEMMQVGVLPDLQARAGITAVIKSRILRTWGTSESGLAEMLDAEIEHLDTSGTATIAFLASGWDGLKVRITAKADTDHEVTALLNDEEQRVRDIIGPIVFGVDDQTMESVVLDLCRDQGLHLALAESLTGGLIGARLTDTVGASDVFRGSIVAYDTAVKRNVLGTPDVPAVSEEMARAMVEGACRVLDAEVGLAVTGVAGPGDQDGEPAGSVWMATLVDGVVEANHVTWPFDRERTRQFTTITVLSQLRARLVARAERA